MAGTVTVTDLGIPQYDFHVARYGAVGNASFDSGADISTATDDYAAIQQAIDAAATAGGGVVVLDAKCYAIGTALVLKPNVVLQGQGMYRTMLKAKTDGITVVARHGTGLAKDTVTMAAGGTLGLKDLTVHGYGDRNKVQHNNGSRAVWLGPSYDIVVQNVRVIYSRHFSLSLTSHYGLIENCIIEKSYRDGINSGTCNNLRVIKTKFKHIGDDSLAWHVPATSDQLIQRSLLVQGCEFEYGMGIQALGGQNMSVVNNRFRFVYGYAVKIGQDSGYSEGYATSYNIAIVGNTVENIIQPTVVGLSSTQKAAFVINQTRSLGAGNSQIPVNIGAYNSATGTVFTGGKPGTMTNAAAGAGTVVVPYDPYHYAGSANTPMGPGFCITIAGNTVTQNLEGAANWSTYGFDVHDSAGKFWTTNGFKQADLTTDNNPAMTAGLVRLAAGVRLQGYLDGVYVGSNTFVGVQNGIEITSFSSLRGCRFTGNSIFRASNGVVFTATSGAPVTVECLISDNSIDIDPFFEAPSGSGGRTSPLDGTWVGATSNYFALQLNFTHGVVFTRNSVRNCNKVVHVNTSTVACFDNSYYWDWSSGNKGIGSTTTMYDRDNRHFFVYSNPTDALYGKAFSPDAGTTFAADSGYLVQSSAIPTQGYFRAGQFVKNSATLTVTSGKVLIGWRRITSGNAHVSGTDWSPVYEYAS